MALRQHGMCGVICRNLAALLGVIVSGRSMSQKNSDKFWALLSITLVTVPYYRSICSPQQRLNETGRVSGENESTVSGENESTVSGENESTVSGEKESTVSGENESTVSGENESTVSGENESTAHQR